MSDFSPSFPDTEYSPVVQSPSATPIVERLTKALTPKTAPSADPKPTRSTRHIDALDGLRGIAILLVIVAHSNLEFGGAFAPGRFAKPFATVLSAGWIGVDLFFVLSGFLITGILFDAKGSSRYFRNFYIRRILRIVPLYFGYLGLILIISHFRAGMFGINPIPIGATISLSFYYYNFWVAFANEGHTQNVNHLWSLAVEEHFYLVWPVMVFMFSRQSLLRICILGVCLSLVLRIGVVLSGLWLQVAFLATPCRLDGLLAGGFVALAIREPSSRAILLKWATRLSIGAGCFLLGLFLGQQHFADWVDFRFVEAPVHIDSSYVLTVGLTALVVMFVGLITFVVCVPPENRLRNYFEASWLVSIGKYSYAMYVFHQLVINLFILSFQRIFPSETVIPSYLTKSILIASVTVTTYCVGYASYHLFEKHFLALKRYFKY